MLSKLPQHDALTPPPQVPIARFSAPHQLNFCGIIYFIVQITISTWV